MLNAHKNKLCSILKLIIKPNNMALIKVKTSRNTSKIKVCIVTSRSAAGWQSQNLH